MGTLQDPPQSTVQGSRHSVPAYMKHDGYYNCITSMRCNSTPHKFEFVNFVLKNSTSGSMSNWKIMWSETLVHFEKNFTPTISVTISESEMANIIPTKMTEQASMPKTMYLYKRIQVNSTNQRRTVDNTMEYTS